MIELSLAGAGAVVGVAVGEVARRTHPGAALKSSWHGESGSEAAAAAEIEIEGK